MATPITLPINPQVNGNYYSWTSLEAVIAGDTKAFKGCKEISYSDGLEPGVLYAPGSAQILGYTVGQYKPEASMTLRKIHGIYLVQLLGNGFLQASFDIQISYREQLGSPIITDQILGCRIKKVEDSHSEGTDPLEMKFDLQVTSIVRYGVTALLPNLGL